MACPFPSWMWFSCIGNSLMSTWRDVHFSPQENNNNKAIVSSGSCSFISISEMRFPGRGQLSPSQADGPGPSLMQQIPGGRERPGSSGLGLCLAGAQNHCFDPGKFPCGKGREGNVAPTNPPRKLCPLQQPGGACDQPRLVRVPLPRTLPGSQLTGSKCQSSPGGLQGTA